MWQVICGAATSRGVLESTPHLPVANTVLDPSITMANFPRPEPVPLAEAAQDAHSRAVECMDHSRAQWYHRFSHAVDVDMRDVHCDLPWPLGGVLDRAWLRASRCLLRTDYSIR